MANSANPEINKKIATSALGTLVIATVFFYLGDRYAETLVTYPGQIFDHLSDAFLSMWQTIKDAPFALDMTSNSLLFGGACFLIIWMIWLRYVAFIGNYRSGEESGSARWGTLKEGKKFKDLQTEDNNLLFTKNFGLALHRPKFDPEYDRNLNVLVVGGSGSGKTFNYVTPNICQLNTSYFVTDPKGTLLKDAGYLFTDNGYKLKSFNTINLDESMHYNPLKYVNDCVKLDNGVYAQVLVMKKFGSELSDRALADMADLPIPMAITWYVQPMDKSKAINYVRTRSAWIDKEIIEEQRSAVNKGYDFSILPQELKYSKEETEDVLDHLQNKNQRLYVFTGLVYTYAESKEALDTQVLRIISTARQNSIELDTYDYRQRQGLNSILPLGHNHVEISRMFTTAQISILVPFATQELDDAGGNFYGQNKHSRNLVVCNRKKLTSPMGFVCGKTGSGKGMFTKTEMTGTIFSNPTDEIYVIDRAGEYTAIAERYGGSTYHFGVGTGTHLNPFDTVSVEHMTRNEQIAFKVDAMLAQAGASAAEAGSNFSEVDQSLVQRCTELAFQKAAERGDNLPPTLQDFYDAANEQPEEQAQVIALRYERFVKGSMNFFNHQSNVDFNTRIVDFNLKDLPDSMLVFALINVCEAVRNRMYFNAKRNVRTWLYVEEMQSMFAYPTVLNYFSRFSNEGRKFGLLLTGISQNATAMLANEAARNIVLNADFLMLLKQSPLDRMKWAELLNLSEQEEECIDESAEPGDGLLIAGNARVPIRGKFPSGNVLYDLFSTNPNETKKTGLGDKKDAKPVI